MALRPFKGRVNDRVFNDNLFHGAQPYHTFPLEMAQNLQG
jgi:hypothetical protein